MLPKERPNPPVFFNILIHRIINTQHLFSRIPGSLICPASATSTLCLAALPTVAFLPDAVHTMPVETLQYFLMTTVFCSSLQQSHWMRFHDPWNCTGLEYGNKKYTGDGNSYAWKKWL